MARLFNIEVFNQSISGDGGSPGVYYTSPEQMAVLGSADALIVQIIVESVGALSTQVTVAYESSNTGSQIANEWGSVATATTSAAANWSDLPLVKPLTITTVGQIGAFGRFKVTSNNNAPAQVRIVVCGRSNS